MFIDISMARIRIRLLLSYNNTTFVILVIFPLRFGDIMGLIFNYSFHFLNLIYNKKGMKGVLTSFELGCAHLGFWLEYGYDITSQVNFMS